MKTVYQEMPERTFAAGRLEILCCLLAHQDEPVHFDEIQKATGLPLDHIENELEELEGPVGGHTENADSSYIHVARCSRQAVFIG